MTEADPAAPEIGPTGTDALIARIEVAERAHFAEQRTMIAEPFATAERPDGTSIELPAASAPDAPAQSPAVDDLAIPAPVDPAVTDQIARALEARGPQAAKVLQAHAPQIETAAVEQDHIGVAPAFAVDTGLSLDAASDVSRAEPPPAAIAVPAPAPARTYRALARRGLWLAAYAVGGYIAFAMALTVVYRFVNPPASTLMIYEGLFGRGAERSWVSLEEISPHLIRAVVVAEDGRFCDHHGIDLAAIREAIQRAGDGVPRGASTISMQVTKNLFLWPSKSYLRKLIELPLTLFMELLWPKSRILEVYLNIAEWGPGVFGAEAAARHHFSRPAASLSEREAAQLAAALPNPIRRDAGDPGPRLQRKASIIQKRARASGSLADCVF